MNKRTSDTRKLTLSQTYSTTLYSNEEKHQNREEGMHECCDEKQDPHLSPSKQARSRVTNPLGPTLALPHMIHPVHLDVLNMLLGFFGALSWPCRSALRSTSAVSRSAVFLPPCLKAAAIGHRGRASLPCSASDIQEYFLTSVEAAADIECDWARSAGLLSGWLRSRPRRLLF